MRELSRRDVLRCSALGLAAATLTGCGGTPAAVAPTGRIDVHQHMIPDAYRRWLATHGVLDVGGIAVPEWSATAAMASMDRIGTARALLSVSAPGVTPAATDAEAQDMARTVNDAGAELAKDHPDRFGFLATLPLPALDAAAREATRALDELRADGVILLAHSGDTYLGQPGKTDLFAELDRRHAVVLVHPGPLPGPTVPGIPPLAADFLLDTTRVAYLLVRNEVVALYPDIRFVLSHAGGFLPYAADRMALVIARDTGLDPTMRAESVPQLLLRHRAVDRRSDTARAACLREARPHGVRLRLALRPPGRGGPLHRRPGPLPRPRRGTAAGHRPGQRRRTVLAVNALLTHRIPSAGVGASHSRATGAAGPDRRPGRTAGSSPYRPPGSSAIASAAAGPARRRLSGSASRATDRESIAAGGSGLGVALAGALLRDVDAAVGLVTLGRREQTPVTGAAGCRARRWRPSVSCPVCPGHIDEALPGGQRRRVARRDLHVCGEGGQGVAESAAGRLGRRLRGVRPYRCLIATPRSRSARRATRRSQPRTVPPARPAAGRSGGDRARATTGPGRWRRPRPRGHGAGHTSWPPTKAANPALARDRVVHGHVVVAHERPTPIPTDAIPSVRGDAERPSSGHQERRANI